MAGHVAQTVDAVLASPQSQMRLQLSYNQKDWQELNLVVGSQIAITNILADLNLAVRYRIAIRTYASKKFWRIIIWQLLRQSTKPPNLTSRQIFQLYGIKSY